MRGFCALVISIFLLGFKFQVSGFKFQVSGFKFQVSGFKFQDSGFKIQVSGFKIQVSGSMYFLPVIGLDFRELINLLIALLNFRLSL